MEISITDYAFATPDYAQSITLRDIILRQPLGLSFTEEELAKEWSSFHIGAFDAYNHLVGCLVLVPKDDGSIKMRQVAVSEDHQGNGIGSKMVKYSEAFCRSRGFRKLVLNARNTAVPFYTNLGYQKIGKEFIEVSVPHYKMEKEL